MFLIIQIFYNINIWEQLVLEMNERPGSRNRWEQQPGSRKPQHVPGHHEPGGGRSWLARLPGPGKVAAVGWGWGGGRGRGARRSHPGHSPRGSLSKFTSTSHTYRRSALWRPYTLPPTVTDLMWPPPGMKRHWNSQSPGLLRSLSQVPLSWTVGTCRC